MIPLRDNIRSSSFPIFTVVIIALNLLVFLFEISRGDELPGFVGQYGFVPARFFEQLFTLSSTPLGMITPVFASMFLHGGWLHVIGNCLYLWIFGDNVEDRLGHFRFLLFYLSCGVAALAAQTAAAPFSVVPNIGASGAIAGVMGAYTFLYPRARVVVLVPILFFFRLFEIPAFFFLGFWVVAQYINSLSVPAAVGALQGGVAWWAHLGVFAAGALLIWRFRKPRNSRQWWV